MRKTEVFPFIDINDEWTTPVVEGIIAGYFLVHWCKKRQLVLTSIQLTKVANIILSKRGFEGAIKYLESLIQS